MLYRVAVRTKKGKTMNDNKQNTGTTQAVEPMNGDRYLSVRTVSEIYDIKQDTIRKWIQKRFIPSYNIRGLVRVKLSDLELMMVRKPSKKEVAKNLLKIA